MKFKFDIDGNQREIEIRPSGNKNGRYDVLFNGKKTRFNVRKIWSRNLLITDDKNRVYNVFVENANGNGNGNDGEKYLFFKGRAYSTKNIEKKRRGTAFEVEGTALIKSPLPGVIKNIEKKEGDEVSSGEGILFLEAMKMENEIKSPKSGILKKIHVSEKDAVNAGDKLFVVE